MVYFSLESCSFTKLDIFLSFKIMWAQLQVTKRLKLIWKAKFQLSQPDTFCYYASHIGYL